MRFQSARQTLMHRCASLPATLQVRSGRRPITFGLEGSPIRCSGQTVSLGRHDTKRKQEGGWSRPPEQVHVGTSQFPEGWFVPDNKRN